MRARSDCCVVLAGLAVIVYVTEFAANSGKQGYSAGIKNFRIDLQDAVGRNPQTVPGELWAEICVPEDKIRPVKLGQEAEMYLNRDPGKGYPISVKEVSPRADVVQSLGNVYSVRADFRGSAQTLKVGMKGVGKIHTETTNLYSIVAQDLAARWNQFALFFF
jgi:hypothetical protein